MLKNISKNGIFSLLVFLILGIAYKTKNYMLSSPGNCKSTLGRKKWSGKTVLKFLEAF